VPLGRVLPPVADDIATMIDDTGPMVGRSTDDPHRPRNVLK
jgi:hypothetical protein